MTNTYTQLTNEVKTQIFSTFTINDEYKQFIEQNLEFITISFTASSKLSLKYKNKFFLYTISKQFTGYRITIQSLIAKKITLTTIKSFIKKNLDNLLIQEVSSFDGMTDGIEFKKNKSFVSVKEDVKKYENTLGIHGAWFVFQGIDYFTAYEDANYTGFEIYNCCGSFTLAIKK